jgi:hypothetical protein
LNNINENFMTNNIIAIVRPCAGTPKPKTQSALTEVVAAEILQGNFTSDTDRDEFSQAIKMHGVTFLYLANSPLSKPSPLELGMINRVARLLSRFWPQALVIGGCHD